MNRKGFVPIVILLIVVGVLIIGGLIYYEIQKSSSAPSATQIGTAPISTASPTSTNSVQSNTSSSQVNPQSGLSAQQFTVAQDGLRVADVSGMEAALSLYKTDCGHYPGFADSNPKCNAPNITTWNDLVIALDNESGDSYKYRNDPIPTRSYCYGVGENGHDYIVGSVLVNPPLTNQSAISNIAASVFTMFVPGNPACTDNPFTYWQSNYYP
jgi:hypothetical protein